MRTSQSILKTRADSGLVLVLCDQCALGSVTCALSDAPLSFDMSVGVAPQMFPPEMLDRLRKSHVSEQVHLFAGQRGELLHVEWVCMLL
jgi:hypothetical protein